ncbi:nickel pincer cofactor biosynthesis protein LarB [Oleidesulfovibrio sp.]|uniref:nickel pincer cofactor biosynthesis protein LarB n=1 Tax=Oleidesulfovibrio sp. TaxID=2909707 RepID=UPI003A87321C
MTKCSVKTLATLLQSVASGNVTPQQAMEQLSIGPFSEILDGISPDHHRLLRTGMGETVFAQGKDDDRLAEATNSIYRQNGAVLVTRCTPEQGRLLSRCHPAGEFWPQAGLFSLGRPLNLTPPWPLNGEALVVTAGTADMRTALEALGTLRFSGINAGLICDVGVAGLHRLKPHLPALADTRVVIACAGMEGALPSVLAGFISAPLVAVPTSVGYGTGTGGIAALLAMLNSCAAGVTVTNIDNGYGAATFAIKMLKQHQHRIQSDTCD